MIDNPNIILLTIDCLRYDKCGFSGYKVNTTPNLDALASKSVVFDEAYAAGPRTAESVPGFLSSRLSAECSYIDELSFKSIPEDSETLATWLKREGYTTKAVLANPQLSPIRNFDKGFNSFKNLRILKKGDKFAEDDTEDSSGGSLALSIKKRLNDFNILPIDPVRIGYTMYRARQLNQSWATVDGSEVIDEAIDVLDGNSEQPQFLWTHLNDLHSPLHPKRVQKGGLITANKYWQLYGDSKRLTHQEAPMYEHMYDSMLRYVDAQIGRLLNFIEEIGIDDETIIIVSADHGEAMLDRGIYGHAAGAEQRLHYEDRDYLHRELLHVPLFMSIPGCNPQRINEYVSLLWLHELIANAANLPHGEFHRQNGFDQPINSFESDSPVISDTLTENGHTVTVRNKSGMLYAAMDEEMEEMTSWSFSSSDRMERNPESKNDAPNELITVWSDVQSDPRSLTPLGTNIDIDTKDMLSDLGYL